MVTTSWHGFQRAFDYLKASVAMGTPIVAALYAMLTYALDERYAPIDITEHVHKNGSIVAGVAKDVQELRAALEDMRSYDIQDQIIDFRLRACDAGSSEARQFFTQRLAMLSDEYKELTGRAPYMPTCEDLQ